MKKELDELLRERYPRIFALPEGAIQQPRMRWGFECGDGWFDLIDTLCQNLQSLIDDDKAPQIIAVQVKEKWGQLRFYSNLASDEQWGMIRMAEAMSTRICDQCGKPGRVFAAGVYMTRCPEHTPEGAMTRENFEAKSKKVGPR